MAAYLIVDITDVRDEKAYASYRSAVPGSLAAAGGRYLVRGGPIDVLEGDWQPGRIVVVRFESAAAACRWWGSPEYAELKRLRQASTTANMILVDGIPEGSVS
jgi:uncharacterized protein (DUF1330 family)